MYSSPLLEQTLTPTSRSRSPSRSREAYQTQLNDNAKVVAARVTGAPSGESPALYSVAQQKLTKLRHKHVLYEFAREMCQHPTSHTAAPVAAAAPRAARALPNSPLEGPVTGESLVGAGTDAEQTAEPLAGRREGPASQCGETVGHVINARRGIGIEVVVSELCTVLDAEAPDTPQVTAANDGVPMYEDNYLRGVVLARRRLGAERAGVRVQPVSHEQKVNIEGDRRGGILPCADEKIGTPPAVRASRGLLLELFWLPVPTVGRRLKGEIEASLSQATWYMVMLRNAFLESGYEPYGCCLRSGR